MQSGIFGTGSGVWCRVSVLAVWEFISVGRCISGTCLGGQGFACCRQFGWKNGYRCSQKVCNVGVERRTSSIRAQEVELAVFLSSDLVLCLIRAAS